MTRNMGSTDRFVRALLVAPAAAVAALVIGPSEVAGLVLLVFAAIMLATSAAGTCPLYMAFGMSTCRSRHGRAGTA